MKESSERGKSGLIFEIQRMSTEDGPGIRTTLFVKGCPLRCGWCHNPESLSRKPEVLWIGVRCIGCGRCAGACPTGALAFTENGVSIDRALCRGCGTCAGVCPSTAMELVGVERDAEGLLLELIKDRSYFEKSGGGVTVSGGESTMQADFVANLLGMLKREGIHTAVDTCGLCAPEVLEKMLPFTDLVLYDLKEIDPGLHRNFTGSTNQKILENLKYLCSYAENHIFPREIWIRTPIIPGATDRDENIEGIGLFLASLPAGAVARWELCAFNNLCGDKYTRLGMIWEYAGRKLMTSSEMERLACIARNSGVRPAIVSWTGAVRDGGSSPGMGAENITGTCRP